MAIISSHCLSSSQYYKTVSTATLVKVERKRCTFCTLWAGLLQKHTVKTLHIVLCCPCFAWIPVEINITV